MRIFRITLVLSGRKRLLQITASTYSRFDTKFRCKSAKINAYSRSHTHDRELTRKKKKQSRLKATRRAFYPLIKRASPLICHEILHKHLQTRRVHNVEPAVCIYTSSRLCLHTFRDFYTSSHTEKESRFCIFNTPSSLVCPLPASAIFFFLQKVQRVTLAAALIVPSLARTLLCPVPSSCFASRGIGVYGSSNTSCQVIFFPIVTLQRRTTARSRRCRRIAIEAKINLPLMFRAARPYE